MRGSGVILFVLVALWALALLPALLRRHDEATETRSVDRFSRAMRVLSRRTPDMPERRYVVMPPRPAGARAPVVMTTREARSSRWRRFGRAAAAAADRGAGRRPAPAAASQPAAPRVTARRPAGATSARSAASRPAPPRRAATTPAAGSAAARRRAVLAARRRRLVTGLFSAFVVALGIALLFGGSWWALPVFVGILLAGDIVHLRGQVRRARQLEHQRRRAAARRNLEAKDASAPRMARSRRRVVDTAATADGVDAETVVEVAEPSAEVTDESWDPVDVPLPTYVTKPAAPQRVIDLTKPGAWTDALTDEGGADESGADEFGADADELAEIIERRRAVGD